MIKDLFALVDHAGNCAQFLNAAVAFAEAHGAYLEVGVLTSPPVAATELAPFLEGYVPDTVVAQNAARRVEEVRQLLASARCPVEVIPYNGDVLWLAGNFKRSRQVADLLLVGPEVSWDIPWLRRRMIETAILSAGTPLLLLPEASGLGKVRRAVIGWKPSREANRAVHDLAALAEPGARIDVAAVGYSPTAEEDECAAGHEVKRHLERHGFRAEVHWLYDPTATTAEVLQRFAGESKADLLAIGGFAHSRAREILLGGVSRELTGENHLPLLLSH